MSGARNTQSASAHVDVNTPPTRTEFVHLARYATEFLPSPDNRTTLVKNLWRLAPGDSPEAQQALLAMLDRLALHPYGDPDPRRPGVEEFLIRHVVPFADVISETSRVLEPGENKVYTPKDHVMAWLGREGLRLKESYKRPM